MGKKAISIKKVLLVVIASVMVIFTVPVRVSAVTINGLGYFVAETARYNSMPGVSSVTGAYDVRGRINNNNSYTLQTTYSNGGYTIDFEVDGNNRSIQKVANNTTITNNGIELTVRAETTSQGLDVHLDINNPEGNGDHTYRVAMTADMQLGNNDYAAIYKKEYSGVVATQDNSSYNSDYGTKVYIDFNPVVDTLWIGDYKERLDNKYVDGEVEAYTVADNVDTAVAWSWDNMLADGEAVTLTVSYNLVETNNTFVSFYDLDEEFIESREALVGGALTLPTLENDREGYFHVWCSDKTNESTCKNGGETIIVEEEDMNLYENYIKDEDYKKNDEPDNEIEEHKDDDTAEYYVRYDYGEDNDNDIIATIDTQGGYYGDIQNDEPEVVVPAVNADVRDDTKKHELEEVKPLGVTMQEDLQGQGFWGLMQQIWPYIIAILCSLGFFFIILFVKRRKDDEDEEEENK